MPRNIATLLLLSTLSGTALVAQSAAPVGPSSTGTYTQTQAAPIERGPRRNLSGVTTQEPAQGVYVRVGAGAGVATVSKGGETTELRVERGVVNVSVHHPAEGSLILVDLPGGQVDLVKDGFYTFNAQTDTVHVLVGEARAFTGAAAGDSKAKGVKVKEYQQFAFAGGGHSTELDPQQARADVLPFPRPQGGESPYRGGPYYGEGFYPAYYGYGYPYGWYGWGYPYGYGFGYPYVGVGFGYGFYGGYGFGGFRGRRF
jgi:hypothetical protein